MSLGELFKKYIGEVTYGAIDGLVTTFAVIAGSVGAGFSRNIIIILALANVVADGFSMSVGCYFSTKNGKRSRGKDFDEHAALRKATATYVSFITFGMMPVLVYIVNWPCPFVHASVITGTLFLLIGSWKSLADKGAPPFKQAVNTFVFGAIACLISYGLGDLLQRVIVK